MARTWEWDTAKDARESYEEHRTVLYHTYIRFMGVLGNFYGAPKIGVRLTNGSYIEITELRNFYVMGKIPHRKNPIKIPIQNINSNTFLTMLNFMETRIYRDRIIRKSKLRSKWR